jgi:hypothetical protein
MLMDTTAVAELNDNSVLSFGPEENLQKILLVFTFT